MKHLGSFQTMPIINFPLYYQGNKSSGLVVWIFGGYVGFHSIKPFQCRVQIELAALYCILSYSWILRMIAEAEGDIFFHLKIFPCMGQC